MKFLFTLLLITSLAVKGQADLYEARKDTLLMGSAFQFTALHSSKDTAEMAVRQAVTEVMRIEALISSWQDVSETTAINENAGKQAVKVSLELYQLIERAKKVSVLSGGAFDISFASIQKVWHFDGSMKELPSEEEVRASVARINYKNIILNSEDTSVFLKEEGMRIGFGAIGKGYAADRAAAIMKQLGIENGIVNAGGDLLAWGQNLSEKDWKIGIADPEEKKRMISWIDIRNTAIVTSGNYEKFVEIDRKRYCHIIHPQTGWPVEGIKSVSVLCPSAELADALATTIFVMGAERGLDMVNQLKGIECFIITDSNDMLSSKNLKLNYYTQ